MTDRATLLVPAAALLCLIPPASADNDANVAQSTDRRPLHTIVPQYPERARRDRIEGVVQVCFNVDRKGKTHRVAVRTSTNRLFEKPSMKAVRASTYRPLPKNQALTGIKTCRTFRYYLSPVAIEKPS